jgi:hypothetical protein
MTLSTLTTASNASGSSTATVGAFGSTSIAQDRLPRNMPLFIPAEQAYYWSYVWQASEARARADLREGRARSFDNPTDAVRYLLGSD